MIYSALSFSNNSPVDVVVDNGIVTDIKQSKSTDVKYATLGLVDIHTHGAMGHDITECTQEALDKISKYYLDNGITAFCPTFVATPLEKLNEQLTMLYSLEQKYAKMLPAHLEGPFISLKHKGAQPAENISDTFLDSQTEFFKKHKNHIGIVTLCPAVKNADLLTKCLAANGIKVQGGHDDSIYPDIVKCMDNGLDGVTHIYCGCSLAGRDKNFDKHMGLTECGLYFDNLYTEVIADGKHISSDLLKFILKCKPHDKVIFVSDSLAPAGMDKGIYKLGTHDVYTDTKVCYLSDMSALAGSVTNLSNMVALAVKNGVAITDVLDFVSTNPRKYFGLKTDINVGDKADFVVFDKDGNLKTVVC